MAPRRRDLVADLDQEGQRRRLNRQLDNQDRAAARIRGQFGVDIASNGVVREDIVDRMVRLAHAW